MCGRFDRHRPVVEFGDVIDGLDFSDGDPTAQLVAVASVTAVALLAIALFVTLHKSVRRPQDLRLLAIERRYALISLPKSMGQLREIDLSSLDLTIIKESTGFDADDLAVATALAA